MIKKIQVKDLQFPKFFILNELDIDPVRASQALNVEIEVQNMGEPDSVVFKGNKLLISQPSSLTRFLFNVLYGAISKNIPENAQRDKFSLGLLFACKDYTYSDYDVLSSKKDFPPVMMSLDKIPILDVLIKDLIEPIAGKIEYLPILFIESNFIDACKKIESAEKFSKMFKLPLRTVSIHDYPFLVVNSSLNNSAAQYSGIIYQTMIHSFGEEKTEKIVKNIILSQDSNIASHFVEIIKILNGDPIFIMDFLKFFKSNVTLNKEEEIQASEIRQRAIAADSYLHNRIKVAGDGKHTPSVFKQWHQWSMIVGLIEKQLAPMRGSMWPASDNIKPIEDAHRQLEVKRSKEKGKSQLNFEELLELAREWYDHKSVQPGHLAEHMLKEHRVWKT